MTKCEMKNVKAQAFITLTNPNLLLNFVENTMKKHIGSNVEISIQEFVSLSTCYPAFLK